MDIIAKIKQINDERERVDVQVPEWDTVLFFPKGITVAEQRRIRAGVAPDDEGGLLASFIIHQAQTKDGAPAFQKNAETIATLEGAADMMVLQRIVSEVGDVPSVEDAKNA